MSKIYRKQLPINYLQWHIIFFIYLKIDKNYVVSQDISSINHCQYRQCG